MCVSAKSNCHRYVIIMLYVVMLLCTGIAPKFEISLRVDLLSIIMYLLGLLNPVKLYWMASRTRSFYKYVTVYLLAAVLSTCKEQNISFVEYIVHV